MRKLGVLTANQIDLMEVCGFDLLAQVEALLRHAREYQRELQHMRHAAARSQAYVGVRRRIYELRQVCASLAQTLDMISDTDQKRAATALAPANPESCEKVGEFARRVAARPATLTE